MGETARGVGDPSELSWRFLCKSKTILKRHFYCRRARGRYLSPPPAAPLLRPLPPPSLLTLDSVQCTAVDDRQGERQEMKPATYSSPLVTVKPQGLWAAVLRHVSSISTKRSAVGVNRCSAQVPKDPVSYTLHLK